MKKQHKVPKNRPAFHVDDKLKEAGKLAAEAFETEGFDAEAFLSGKKKKQHQKWEYLIYNDKSLGGALFAIEKYGEAGWELVSIINAYHDKSDNYIFIFKRPVF